MGKDKELENYKKELKRKRKKYSDVTIEEIWDHYEKLVGMKPPICLYDIIYEVFKKGKSSVIY